MDIASAQLALDRFGRVDRLEVRLADTVMIAEAESAIARRLPAGLSVQRPAQRGEQVEHMLAAFHLNLTALSYVALLVGLFLVYNTVSVAVLSRREEIGTLRALGVGRSHVRWLFLAEAAALAGVGAALGIVVGRLLADGAVALTSTAVSAIYIATAAAPPSLGWRQVMLAFATAVPLALLAAFIPAQEAAGVPPTAAMRGADRIDRDSRLPRYLRWAPVVLLALAAWLATLGPLRGLPIFGYASAIAVGLRHVVAGAVDPHWRGRWHRASGAPAAPRRGLAGGDQPVGGRAAPVHFGRRPGGQPVDDGGHRDHDRQLSSDRRLLGRADPAGRSVHQSRQPAGNPASPARCRPTSSRLVTASPDVAAADRFRVIEVPYGETGIRVGGGEFAVLLTHGSLLFKAPADGARGDAHGHRPGCGGGVRELRAQVPGQPGRRRDPADRARTGDRSWWRPSTTTTRATAAS